jgi:hypothetical protein
MMDSDSRGGAKARRLTLVPFPDDFPNKGRYFTYSKSWDRIGYADCAQYPGHWPIRFPEDASPFECFLGGYLRAFAASRESSSSGPQS